MVLLDRKPYLFLIPRLHIQEKRGRIHSAIPKSTPITAHSLNHSCLTSLRLTHQQAEHPQRCIQRTACAHTYGQKYITLLTNLRCLYKELLSHPQPKCLFCVVSHLLCKHTLTHSHKEFHLLLSCRTTKPKFVCTVISSLKSSSQHSGCTLGSHLKTVSARKVRCARSCTQIHTPLHTRPRCTLIAPDSSHCKTQCSPPLCCAVITLAALILSPSPFLQFSTSLLDIALFLPLSVNLPLSLARSVVI